VPRFQPAFRQINALDALTAALTLIRLQALAAASLPVCMSNGMKVSSHRRQPFVTNPFDDEDDDAFVIAEDRAYQAGSMTKLV